MGGAESTLSRERRREVITVATRRYETEREKQRRQPGAGMASAAAAEAGAELGPDVLSASGDDVVGKVLTDVEQLIGFAVQADAQGADVPLSAVMGSAITEPLSLHTAGRGGGGGAEGARSPTGSAHRRAQRRHSAKFEQPIIQEGEEGEEDDTPGEKGTEAGGGDGELSAAKDSESAAADGKEDGRATGPGFKRAEDDRFGDYLTTSTAAMCRAVVQHTLSTTQSHFVIAVDGSAMAHSAFETVMSLRQGRDFVTLLHVFDDSKEYLPMNLRKGDIRDRYDRELRACTPRTCYQIVLEDKMHKGRKRSTKNTISEFVTDMISSFLDTMVVNIPALSTAAAGAGSNAGSGSTTPRDTSPGAGDSSSTSAGSQGKVAALNLSEAKVGGEGQPVEVMSIGGSAAPLTLAMPNFLVVGAVGRKQEGSNSGESSETSSVDLKVLGSVTDVSMRSVYCPTIIVKKHLSQNNRNTFLLATDGSIRAENAYLVTLTLMKPRDRIIILQVVDEEVEAELPPSLRAPNVAAKFEYDIRTRGLVDSRVLTRPKPSGQLKEDVLIGVAEEEDADFVVLAPRPDAEAILSTAEHVIGRCNCNMIVCKS